MLPGLINAHTHGAFSIARGLAPDLRLNEWLPHVFAAAERIDAQAARAGALLSCAEHALSGTTTFVDHHYALADRASSDAIARTVDELGIRVALAPTLSDLGAFAVDEDAATADVARLVETWHGSAGGRIEIWLGLASPVRRESEGRCRLVRKLADEYDLRWTFHFAETRDWLALPESVGCSSLVEVLANLDLLEPRALLAHGVWLADSDLRTIAGSGTSICYNPVSNMYLADGVAPLPNMRAAGVNVALGTDAANCNNKADLFEAMKVGALLQKIGTGDPAVIGPRAMLEMATISGARAIGRGTDLGSLEVGKRADLVLVDFSRPHLVPSHDVLSNLVYCGSARDVDTVIVGGRTVVEGGSLLLADVGEILARARREAQRLW